MAAEVQGEDSNHSQVLAHFQEITGVDDEAESVRLLTTYRWELELAVQHVLSEREGVAPIVPQPGRVSPIAAPLTSTPIPHQRHTASGPPLPRVVAASRAGPGAVAPQPQSWWQWLMSLAFFPLQLVVTTASDLLQLVANLLFGFQPSPARNPTADVGNFVSEFEAQYGTEHPEFLRCSYNEAVNHARQNLKFLLVYLHSPGHQDTAEFCRSVLASRDFATFLSSLQCLCWGVAVGSEEGVRVSYVLRETTYPFLALVVLKQSRMVVCERVEGCVGREELQARLAAVVRANEAQLVVERTERTRRVNDRSLREEQDQAYQDSLRADKEKEEQKMREEREREQEEEREREESRVEQQKKEAFETECAVRMSRLPPEPQTDDSEAIHVMLRMPNGERIERRFLSSDNLESVYDFVYTADNVPQSFTLLVQFPRRELECGHGGGPALAELALGKKCVLIVHDSSEED